MRLKVQYEDADGQKSLTGKVKRLKVTLPATEDDVQFNRKRKTNVHLKGDPTGPRSVNFSGEPQTTCGILSIAQNVQIKM